MTQPEILVVGGTGLVGRELVGLLCRDRIPVRVLSRSAKSRDLFASRDVEIATGDLNRPDSLLPALDGVHRVFMVTRDHPAQAEREGNLIEAAARSGVDKIVKSSAYAAGLAPPVGYGIPHAASERKLMDSGMRWVILRPYMFMQNLLELADLVRARRVLPMPLGDAGVGIIDARDVAAAGKCVLVSDAFDGEAHELTGPEVVTMAECAKTLSETLGRRIRYRSPPYWLAGLMMRLQGTSSWDVRMRKQLFRMIRDGGEARVTGRVERITGHEPRSLARFLREFAAQFS